MTSLDHVIVPSFAQLNIPPVEEYHKRKVALISGQGPSINLNKRLANFCSLRYHWTGWILLVSVGRVLNNALPLKLPRTELLLSKGYQVHGIIRRSSSFNTGRLHHLYEDQHERKYPQGLPSNVSLTSSHRPQ